MTVKAVYEDGVLKPKAPLPLKEHEEVEIDVRRAGSSADVDDDPTGWKTADDLIGFMKDGPKGPIGEEHDHHLYGK
jgi:predicted DNA-binding antitoxin AbrB/MazE fold protein